MELSFITRKLLKSVKTMKPVQIILIRWALLFLLYPLVSSARVLDLPYGMQADISGYIGWRQIFSAVEYDSIPSEPELGLLTNLKVTDRLKLFNQFKYGTNLESVLVYNQVSYTPYVPIDDFVLVLKGGKLRYDNNLYNVTRINPRTRIGVYQPQSIYWDTLGQPMTSGYGVGFDFQYKQWSGSYVVDKQVISDPTHDAAAWTTGRLKSISSNFGDHHMASIQYEMPEYGVRLKASYNKSTFDAPIEDAMLVANKGSTTIGIDYFDFGGEWKNDRWLASMELMVTRHQGENWFNTKELAYGGSALVEYQIDNHWVVRANYNGYHSAVRPKIPQLKYNKDVNFGVGWSDGDWLANMDVHYVQGGRLVHTDNFLDNPGDYKQFWVIGVNLVYFWN